jgi:NADH:ubiquinone oxidoreductase subunit K
MTFLYFILFNANLFLVCLTALLVNRTIIMLILISIEFLLISINFKLFSVYLGNIFTEVFITRELLFDIIAFLISLEISIILAIVLILVVNVSTDRELRALFTESLFSAYAEAYFFLFLILVFLFLYYP